MAYFLPSYFQKRLLRYALTRLDFIETDALNLEDLDLTLGQRSVIELKNVGIKVSKLIEKLQIPPSVLLSRASIRYLRITIPADLHISGIAVELDGIDVQVELQENGTTKRKDTGSAPRRADAANRPRIASPHVHDPGGNATDPFRTGQDHLQHVIPTSEDLAMSYLESEPRHEREELEAAIQSQSQRLPESTSELDGSLDESGIGMPGGFSLPGFVAKFFAGVADRLSVSIKNVTASITMKLGADNSTAEIIKVLVKLAAISLESLQPDRNMHHQRSQRSISVDGFEILLMSEAETFARPSATSSPKLARSRSKLSTRSDDGQISPSDSLRQQKSISPSLFQSTLQNRGYSENDPSSDESTTSSQLADLSVDRLSNALDDSSIFHQESTMKESETLHRGSTSQQNRSGLNIDNRKHAESLVGSSTAMRASSDYVGIEVAPNEDLSESKMFTHEQAASMYMSAVSEAVNMPGAWDRPDIGASQQSPDSDSPRDSPMSTSKITAGVVIAPDLSHEPTSSSADDSFPESQSRGSYSPEIDSTMVGLVAKQLVHIDRFSISFPSSVSKVDSEQTLPQPLSTNTAPTNITSSMRNAVPSRIPSGGHLRTASRDFVVCSDFEYVVSIGNLSVNLDMAVSRILLGAASQTNKYFQHEKEPSSLSSRTSFSSSFSIGNLSINLCQSVPETSTTRILDFNFQEPNSANIMDSCLLQFTMINLNHELAITPSSKRQKLQIQQIVLGHSVQKYLYFVDSFGLRDSVASSQLIKPNDFFMTNQDDRFDVQIKPMHAVIDLLKVDDILSRSGGLSSILDLGNSILSTGTITENTPKPKSSPTRQRAVRFDTTPARSHIDNDAVGPGMKIDVRVSGAVVDLIGSECSVQVRSSAIKLVSRTGSLRTQIDTVILAGPVLGKSKTKPGVNVRLSNIGLHFKDSPEEQDLDRLLSLLTPSSDKYDDEDDIMVDTLIRQRRKGAVLSINVTEVKVDITGIAWLKHVTRLGDELSKLATVTKYLPEDDRPGILTFGLVNNIDISTDFGRPFGILHANVKLIEGAIISVPSLMAAQANNISIKRGRDTLLGDVIPNSQETTLMGPPMLMCRFIADEMEPTIRIKLSNACIEYTVPMVIAVTDLAKNLKVEDQTIDVVSSEKSSDISTSPSDKSDFVRKVQLSLVVRDSAIALNPARSTARGLVLLSDAVLMHRSKHAATNIHLDLKKASILIIDDIARLGHESTNADHKLYFEENDQVQELTKAGYVPVGSISNASANIGVTNEDATENSLIDVEFRNNLFLLETCADSTQTLIQILSDLAPPSPPSQTAKYRTEVVPIQDMLASFTGNAFVSEPGPELGLQASQVSQSTTTTDDYDDEDDESELGIHEIYDEGDVHDRMTESYLDSELSQSRMTGSLHVAPVNPTASPDPPMGQSIMAHSMLDFRTDHFVQKSSVGGTAHRWNSAENTYGLGSENCTQESPLKVRVRDVHVIWNLFDGYDWQNTRDTISQAVKDLETKAMARKPRRRDSRLSPGAEDDQSVIGDFLFNSIYIGIPANKDPRELANAINQDLGDVASETGSYATGTTVTASPSGRVSSSRSKPKKLRLNRSKQHKMTFELKGLSADFIAFPPETGEVESSVDVRVRMLEIFDHVPTSTWKKFVTYMHEAGEREIDTNMVHLELLNVKPVAELSASEIVMKLTVLPLRLHIDQDALDFLTRFFEFKDERAPVSDTPSAPPFIQRAEVNPVRLRLDFKPKRVDYGGLRSGRTTEFMNFFVLDKTDIVLRRIILYGVSGFDRLGITLNNIWTPDVKKNQLSTVLSGLAPIRSLVDVGSGVKDLVAVPIREYKKDGRIVRSIQKGAIAFAKTTTTELVNLGAKLAIGTQTVLQNAEEVLVPREQGEDEAGEKELISLYADQPIGIVQGLRTAYASLERDLLLAKDAIVAVPGEVIASGSATGAAKAIMRQSPTIILRPAIGATKAVGQALLGAGNTLDKGNLRRIEDKYKHR